MEGVGEGGTGFDLGGLAVETGQVEGFDAEADAVAHAFGGGELGDVETPGRPLPAVRGLVQVGDAVQDGVRLRCRGNSQRQLPLGEPADRLLSVGRQVRHVPLLEVGGHLLDVPLGCVDV